MILEIALKMALFPSSFGWFNVSPAICIWSSGVIFAVLVYLIDTSNRQYLAMMNGELDRSHYRETYITPARAWKYLGWFLAAMGCWVYTMLMAELGISYIPADGEWPASCYLIASSNFILAGIVGGLGASSLKEV